MVKAKRTQKIHLDHPDFGEVHDVVEFQPKQRVKDRPDHTVVLHVSKNGIVTIGPITSPDPEYVDRKSLDSIIADEVRMGRLQNAKTIAEQEGRPRAEDENVVVSIPLIAVKTIEDAKLLRAMFCQLVRLTPNPLCTGVVYGIDGEQPKNVYVLNRFGGELLDAFKVSKDMAAMYKKIQTKQSREQQIA